MLLVRVTMVTNNNNDEDDDISNEYCFKGNCLYKVFLYTLSKVLRLEISQWQWIPDVRVPSA